MATTLYGTLGGIIDRWSIEGVSLRVDDGPPTDLGRAMQRASRTIDKYLLLLYTESQLATSEWVKEAADDLGAYYLGARRGNPIPSSIAEFYDLTLEDLKEMRKGLLLVPDASPRRAAAPRLSNISIRMRPTPHSRVEKRRSTGRAKDYVQRRDSFDPLEYYPVTDF